jgi:acetoacetyl-CoA reductase
MENRLMPKTVIIFKKLCRLSYHKDITINMEGEMARLVLVTGGTRGIGEAICKAFKEKDYIVAATYISDDADAMQFQKKTGIEVCKWDVSDYNQCMEGVQKLQDKLKQHVEILVNNAGITRDAMLHKSSFEDWQAVINTNLTSCYNMCRSVITNMRDNNFGRIINISSINGLSGQLGQTNYSASKAGVIGFTKALALESAAKGITVNAIAPGYTNTHMLSKLDPKIIEAIIQKIPVQRLGEPSEIARTALFLAADEAGFITGETLSVNGGQYMQ